MPCSTGSCRPPKGRPRSSAPPSCGVNWSWLSPACGRPGRGRGRAARSALGPGCTSSCCTRPTWRVAPTNRSCSATPSARAPSTAPAGGQSTRWSTTSTSGSDGQWFGAERFGRGGDTHETQQEHQSQDDVDGQHGEDAAVAKTRQENLGGDNYGQGNGDRLGRCLQPGEHA